jgi:MFS family permease
MLAGWVIYAAIYAGWAFADSAVHGWVLFTLYGLFYGLTEGTERAMLVDYADPAERGRVFGWHYFLVGVGSLAAGLLFGVLWQVFGARAAFLTSASLSAAACALLYAFMKKYPAPAAAVRRIRAT